MAKKVFLNDCNDCLNGHPNVPLYIVTLAKNCESLLQVTLESIESIDTHFHHVLVIGESEDSTPIVASEYVNSDSRNRLLLFDTVPGIYEAMNQALDVIPDSCFVWYLNSGDTLTSNHALKSARVSLSLTNAEWGFGPNMFSSAISKNRSKVTALIPPTVSNQLMLRGELNHQQILVRASTIRACGGFDCSFKIASDWKLICELLKREYSRAEWQDPIANFSFGGFAEQHLLKANLELLRLRKQYLHQDGAIGLVAYSYFLFFQRSARIFGINLLRRFFPNFLDRLRFGFRN